MPKVAIIGLGAMGGPIARNLLNGGHSVIVCDKDTERAEELVALGAVRSDLRDITTGAEVAFSIIPRGPVHKEMFLGPEGLVARAAPATLLVDCATSSVELARRIEEESSRRGVDAIDAPLSGGTRGAREGKLTFLVGGKTAPVDRLRAILPSVASTVIHVGGPGAGQAAKICNNMITAGILAVTCEGFALAERLGIPAQLSYDVFSHCSAKSWVLDNHCPVGGVVADAPSSNNYKPGGAASLLLKDITLALNAARENALSVPMTSIAASLYQMLCSRGLGDVDASALIKLISGTDGELRDRSKQAG